MENITINATINVGDAGTPWPVSIDVDYDQVGNVISVVDWLEDSSPYDNPPELWYAQVRDKISDYFYDLNKDYEVVFQ